MISMPPRHGKSEHVSVRFPAYYLAKHPNHQFISASYAAELAFDFGRQVRNLIDGAEYRALFPGVTLAADSQAKNRWHTKQGGVYIAAGLDGGITGRGAHVLSIDDPVKSRAEAEREVERKKAWDWYSGTAYNRLMPGGAIILTMTRWHEDDLAGRLLAAEENGGDKWEKLILPAIDENGKALWEESYPRPVLDQMRKVMSPYDWASLYEQRPRPVEGSFFSVNDLLIQNGDNHAPVPMPSLCDYVFATIDSATKTGKDNDGTAVIYWARSKNVGHPLVILDYDIVQIEGALLETWLPQVFKQLEEFAATTKARVGSVGVWVEDKASGMILLQQAQRRGWMAQPIDSKLTSVGKVERAINISGYVFRKMVKFSQTAYDHVKPYKGSSKNHLLSQILGFHIGTKDMGDDDLLDCFSYGVAIALGNADGF
jgi:hypothetical protein